MPVKQKKRRIRKIIDPKTSKEAISMIQKGWFWFLRKYPTLSIPLTVWMLFGGVYFSYTNFIADKFEVKKAQPIGEFSPIQQEHGGWSIMSSAEAAEQDRSGVPIRWNKQLWGYEDTTFVAKVLKGSPAILVLDKKSGEVVEVQFYGTDYKKQMRQQQYK